MIGEVCYWIFNMSIIASFMGLIVLLIRKIRFIPHRVSVFLWIVPFVRMLIPLGLNSPYSLMSLISRITTRTVTVYRLTEDLSLSTSNTIMAAESYDPITYKVNILENIFNVAGIVWTAGAVTVFLVLVILYCASLLEIRDAVPFKEDIYLSGKVVSPAVYGIFRPRIILPSSYAEKDLKYIIRHERTHIHRKDNLWRLLGFFAASVHWFNPLSWLFLKEFLSDLELACDEKAVSSYGRNEQKEYALTILEYSGKRNMFASSFGGAKVRSRIENILSYKKMTAVSASVFTVMVLIIIYTLLTNAG